MTPYQMVEDLLNLGNLTHDEASFLIGMSNKLEWGTELEVKEMERLEEIYRARI